MWFDIQQLFNKYLGAFFSDPSKPPYDENLEACKQATNLIEPMQAMLLDSFYNKNDFNHFLALRPEARIEAKAVSQGLKGSLLKCVKGQKVITFEMDMFADALEQSKKTHGFSIQQYLFMNNHKLAYDLLEHRPQLEQLFSLYNDFKQRGHLNTFDSLPPIDLDIQSDTFSFSENLCDEIVSLKI